MDSKNWLKRHLEEASFDENEKTGASRVLEALAETPRAAVEPPPGYEARLLARLSEQLPPPKAAASRRAPGRAAATPGGLRSFIPQWAWGVAGVLVASFVWSAAFKLTRRPGGGPGGSDLLAAAAQKSPEAVAQWLASIGDTGSYGTVVAAADSSLLARSLSEADLKRLEGALGPSKRRSR